jgi:NTE family protein
MIHQRRTVAVLLLAVLPGSGLTAAEADDPKVVLVLSGGGARGMAHIGVLEVLEQLHVRVDMVVGTSMGSIVGGMYASGWSPEEIRSTVESIDWKTVFVDTLERKYRTFQRKQDDTYLVPLKLRFKNWKPYLPPSVIGGQSLALQLQKFEILATGERDFDKFPIPYRAVAADLSTGDAVVLDHGSLATAMRASMAVPGVFPPVELEGKPLCDGGIAANYPIRVARSLGAQTIIGVDISSPLRGKQALGNFLQRLDQMTSLLTYGNKEADLKAAEPQDVLLRPELGEISFSDFDKAEEAIAEGRAAALAAAGRLKALAVSDEEWAAFMEKHHRRPPSDRVVDKVVVTNSSFLETKVIDERLHVPLGEPLDEDDLGKQILGLYGLDTFGTIRHELTRQPDGENVLTVDVPKKPYGRNSLQFGFDFEDDFQGDVRFNLSLGHLLNPVNRLGGEWRNLVQIGDDVVFGTAFFQPLDPGMRWFAQAQAEARRDKYSLYDSDGNAAAEYRFDTDDARGGLGRALGEWGQLEVGAYRTYLEAKQRIGTNPIPYVSFDDGGLFASLRVDTVDNFSWPTDGMRADILVQDGLTSFGADEGGTITKVTIGEAGSIGKNVLYGTVELDNSTQNLVSPTVISLGGLFRLSGLKNDQLIGSKGGLIRLMYYRELTSFSLGSLTQRMFAGFSLEAGNAYFRGDPVTWPSLVRAGSIFAGASTILGPAYLGYGYAEGGNNTVYLIIGRRF